MSVSERLKALDEAATPPPWALAPGEQTLGDIEYRNAVLMRTLRNALPQFIAVMEAAERIASEDRYKYRSLDYALATLEGMLSYDDIPGAGQRTC